jgi:uncharacterized membrane protein
MKYILPLLFILFLTTVSASHIQGDIYLYKNGEARFDIQTDIDPNIEELSFTNNLLTGRTNQLISMQEGNWKFYLSNTTYDSILIDIHLPNNLEVIKEINGNNYLIDFENEIVSFIDSGNLQIEIIYELKEEENESVLPIIILLLLLIGGIYLLLRKPKDNRLKHILPIINDKEKKIVELIMKKDERQNKVKKELQIPKASFSRYIHNLEKKGIIERVGEGRNKLLKLKKD